MPAPIPALLLAVLLTAGAHGQDFTKCLRASYCLAIDESSSIPPPQFAQMKTGIEAIASRLDSYAPGSQFTAQAFTTSARTISAPAVGSAALVTALRSHTRLPGGTRISAGLSACQAVLQGMPGPRVTILFSNGGDSTSASSTAATIRATGTTIAAVGINVERTDSSLTGLASSASLRLSAPLFRSFVARAPGILKNFCSALPNPRPICSARCPTAAVCLAVDESGSTSRKVFAEVADMLASVTSSLGYLTPGSLYAAVGYSDLAHVVQPVTTDRAELIQSLLTNPQRRGGSASGAALNRCAELMAGLPGPRVIVLVADGPDNKAPTALAVADGVKKMGFTIVTFGVGGVTPTLSTVATRVDGEALATGLPRNGPFSPGVGGVLDAVCLGATRWKPAAPPSNCARVHCATCGGRLECFVDSGNSVTDARVCKAVMDKARFCSRSKGRKTKCGQRCEVGTGRVVCFQKDCFGKYKNNPKCRGVDAGGAPLFPENFAEYEACGPVVGSTSSSCKKRVCNVDNRGSICYPDTC